ncbi:hypothetical protein ACFY78_33785 [Streptomyces olindensis]
MARGPCAGCASRGGHAELLATDALYRELVEALRIAADPQSV